MSIIRDVINSPNKKYTDAFDVPIVGEPFSLVDSKTLGDSNAKIWDVQTIGTGANSYIRPYTTLTAPADGDAAIVQTKMRFDYQTGKGFHVKLTGILGNDDVSVNIGNNGTINKISRDQWDDPLDGTGPSQLNIDFTNENLFFLEFEWLGVGDVFFGIYANGSKVYCHQVKHTNTLTAPYMQSPNHSIRYEIRNSSGTYTNKIGYFNTSTVSPFTANLDGLYFESVGTQDTVQKVCSSVDIFGGRQLIGELNGIHRLDHGSNDTWTPAIALRLRDNYEFATVIAESLSVATETGGDGLWALALLESDVDCLDLNGNTTFTDNLNDVTFVNRPNSSVEYYKDFAEDSGFDIANHEDKIIAMGSFSDDLSAATKSLQNAIHIGTKIDGTKDAYLLIVFTDTNETNYVTFNWRELGG